MTFIGEVDFFKKSPYIELLENITIENDLIDELKNRGMPESAINNIIKRLEKLKVLQYGYIGNLENGFPEKEYGKYELEIFKNDSILPFKNKNRKISRKRADSFENIENLKQNLNFIKMVSNDTNLLFRIEKIENNKANIESAGSLELKMIYLNSWKYSIDNKSYDMSEEINFNDIFRGEWDSEYNSLKISFSLLKEEVNSLNSLEYSYTDNIEINNYGKLKTIFQDIPLIPKTKEDAKEWFIYLLKNEIEQRNRYISQDELKQLWNNLLERKPKFKKFNLEFDYRKILNEFGKESKYYWLLQASSDLYPFSNNLTPKERVIIEDKNFENQFNFEIEKIIIIDRYINTIRHFEKLEEILKVFNSPEISIFTTKEYNNREKEDIELIISNNNITKVIKDKNELSHSRYWIFNNKYFYKVGESLDGIDNTSFDLYDKEDIKKIDEIVLDIFQEEIN